MLFAPFLLFSVIIIGVGYFTGRESEEEAGEGHVFPGGLAAPAVAVAVQAQRELSFGVC